MAANPIYVTVAGAGDKGGSTWANAMGRAEWETDLEAPASADDVYYVEEGTYTLTEDIDCSAINGTSNAPITIIGVKSGTSNEPPVFSDHAFTTARPLIAAGAYKWWFGDYWIFKNLRLTTTETWGFRTDAYSVFVNCLSTPSGGSWAFVGTGASNRFLGCEANANAGGFSLGSNNLVFACYAHDGSNDGYQSGGATLYLNSIADTMGIGFDINNRNNNRVIGCTIYNCTTGISGTTAIDFVCLNTILDANTTGASWTNPYSVNVWDYNCWDNTSDVSNVTKGDNAVTSDPGMNSPATGDFAVGTGDAVADVALDAGDLTGATV